MKYLLDTHTLLWCMVEDERVPKEIYDIVNNRNNQIFYSTASVWEIELKHLKYDNFKISGEQFAFLCDQNYLMNLTIQNKHISLLKEFVNKEHKDPFDKILLSQALSENMIFITHDRKFSIYNNKNILLY